jgi:transposase-like protein
MKCHCCESENLVKYGKNARGNQRYSCKICNSISVEDGKFTWLTREEKDLIERIALEGNSIQSIARIVKRDYKAVYEYLKKNSKRIMMITATKNSQKCSMK